MLSISSEQIEVFASDKGNKEEPSCLNNKDDTKIWKAKFEPDQSFVKCVFKKPVQLNSYQFQFASGEAWPDPKIWTVKIVDALTGETHE